MNSRSRRGRSVSSESSSSSRRYPLTIRSSSIPILVSVVTSSAFQVVLSSILPDTRTTCQEYTCQTESDPDDPVNPVQKESLRCGECGVDGLHGRFGVGEVDYDGDL